MKKLNKLELVEKIRHSEGFTLSEKSELIELINHNKRYGLVWEEKNENAELELLDKLPVLSEEVGKAIINKSVKEAPNHVLIEGDNLHALTALCFTHENKIDVIYIDPPYNTGNKDFKYNDTFVDKEDSYRHSKWLSFMNKRLRLAKRLLSPKGVIFISIDDNEQSQLKLLCDEIFTNNFIASLPRITKASGKTTNKIALNHDFILVYCKDKNLGVIEGLEHNDKGFKYSDEYINKRGLYKLNQTLDYDSLQYSSSLDYEIELEGIKLYPGSDYNKYLERKTGKYNRADWAWRWSKDLYEFGLKNDFIVLKHTKNGSRIYTKTYLNAKIEKNENREYFIEYMDRKKPLTSLDFTDASYSNDNAKKDLETVLKQKNFDYPKPISLISTLLKTNPNKSLIVLDFFAGSGTTLHSTMNLNDEDAGNRQCILVTNNENNICEEVTYERNKRIIQGYTNDKGISVAGLSNNNLRYFKTSFVGRERTLKNKRQLTQLSTDVLRIKESCYTEINAVKSIRIFNEDKLYLIVVFDDIAIPKAVEIIQQLPNESIIKVYVFSEEQDPYTEDFYEVLDKIQLCALPDAIYKAYQHILPKKKRTEVEEINASPNLSN